MKTKLLLVLLFVSSVSFSQIYVNVNATGANDGTSWADAFTNLQTALTTANASTTETAMWIAAGTYKPHATDRSVSFAITKNNIEIYGGFNGTETSPTDRDMTLLHSTNETILSGDLQGNDNYNITFNNTTKTDNSLRIVQVAANNIVIDGVSIAYGYADATSGNGRFAAGIGTDDSIMLLTIKNSHIKYNTASWGAGIVYSPNTDGSKLSIESCIFETNLSSYASGFYVFPRAGTEAIFNLSNSLFKFNRTANGSAAASTASGGAVGLIRTYYSATSVTAKIINNTIVNNFNNGTSSYSDFGTIGLSKSQGGITLTAANNIFWGNTHTFGGSNSIVAKAFGNVLNTFDDVFDIYNSIDEDNFSNVSSSFQTNTSNVYPLFTNPSSSVFTIRNASPAKNTGDNSKIIADITPIDLVGNNRIFDTTVDMGCYEYGSSPIAAVNNKLKVDFNLYPNPVKDILTIAMDDDLKQVVIYNLQGQKVLKNNTKQVNVATLSQGIYLIKIEDENGNTAMKKFIKK